jgi:transcriptional regulator with XRE-family HTH domain
MMRLDADVIGKRLRELRGDRSQQEVADAAGVSKMAISKYETGLSIPGDSVKIALANYYGKTVEQIFFTQ